MRKLIGSLFIVLMSVSLCFAGHGMGPGPGCKGYAAGCSASYGGESATSNNATDLGGTETDATTGWSAYSSGTIDSVDTDSPYAGSYHLKATAAGTAQGVSRIISGLTNNTIYKYQFHVKHDGTASATWQCGWLYGASTPQLAKQFIYATDSTYKSLTWYMPFNAMQDSLICQEANGSNNGSIFIDAFSIKEATLCYGSELYTHSNAANIASEANATTGWTAYGDGSVASSSSDPHAGTYHLVITANGTAGDGAIADIGGDFSLTVDKKYMITFWAKSDGSNVFNFGFGASGADMAFEGGYASITSTVTSYAKFGLAITYSTNYRYFKIWEGNAGNTGNIKVDSISIKEITGE